MDTNEHAPEGQPSPLTVLPGSDAPDLPRIPVYQFSQDKYNQTDRPQGRDACAPVVQEENEILFDYDEWDFRDSCYLRDWCCVHEKLRGELTVTT